MRAAARLCAILSALVGVTACDTTAESVGRYHSMAAGPTSLPERSGLLPDIDLVSLPPPLGTPLIVRECSTLSGYAGLCAHAYPMIFGVHFDENILDAVITAGFYAGSQRCGLATSSRIPLTAGRHGAFTTSSIHVVGEPHVLSCRLPVRTDRMVVQLWDSNRPGAPLMRREFPHVVMFDAP